MYNVNITFLHKMAITLTPGERDAFRDYVSHPALAATVGKKIDDVQDGWHNPPDGVTATLARLKRENLEGLLESITTMEKIDPVSASLVWSAYENLPPTMIEVFESMSAAYATHLERIPVEARASYRQQYQSILAMHTEKSGGSDFMKSYIALSELVHDMESKSGSAAA